MQGGEWESCMAGGHQAGIAQRGGRGCPARPKLERARGCPGLCAGGAGHSARISGAVGGRRGPRGGGSSGGVPPPVQPPYTPRLRAVLPPPTVAERGRRRLAGAGGGGGQSAARDGAARECGGGRAWAGRALCPEGGSAGWAPRTVGCTCPAPASHLRVGAGGTGLQQRGGRGSCRHRPAVPGSAGGGVPCCTPGRSGATEVSSALPRE